MEDSRDRYRCLDNGRLLEEARREGVTAEMGVVLAERLAAGLRDENVGGYGNFNTRSK